MKYASSSSYTVNLGICPLASLFFYDIAILGKSVSISCRRLHCIVCAAKSLHCRPPLSSKLCIETICRWNNSRANTKKHLLWILFVAVHMLDGGGLSCIPDFTLSLVELYCTYSRPLKYSFNPTTLGDAISSNGLQHLHQLASFKAVDKLVLPSS